MRFFTTSFTFASIAASATVAVAQSLNNTPAVVCVAGQCLQGFSNTTLGTTISASGAQTSVLLLPGQYTASTNPQLLHDLLTSSSASLSPSSGFENSSSSTSLPLDIALSPGLAIYSDSLYGGSAGFSSLPTSPLNPNSSTPISAESFALSDNVWVALSIGSQDRVVLWESVPDVSQLSLSGSISLLDIQSSRCSPSCSSNGVCSASSGSCVCQDGFTGTSCESCAPGHFGPKCQVCPQDCDKCDEGINGSGVCLSGPQISNAPSTCNCLNGECSSSGGQCTCNPGWTTADNGTACAKCASGFFLTSTGDCSICQLGCTSCSDGTGQCLSCASGFTQDANDKTKCNAVASTTSSGQPCPDGSFADGTQCQKCSPSCQTCKGATSNDCIICAQGSYKDSNGNCVSADANGVCQGNQQGLIADNVKHECDACGAKCKSCKIPNFSTASTVSQAQCTSCLPGSFLSNGKCVGSCPTGTFVSPSDNTTCTPCDSSCKSCVGSANFCLECSDSSSLVTGNGQCVKSCPEGSVQSSSSSSSSSSSTSRTCTTCHPDCLTCSGPSFNQCSSCPSSRPVLSNDGRCLPTCSKSQFFDKTSSSCQSCHESCDTCFGSGKDECLSCSNGEVVKSGSCVQASCTNNSTVVQGLGVCLSELVQVPQPSGTSSNVPALPSLTGLSSPTTEPPASSGKLRLEWWEILLMALGCAFIFLVIVLCWRRRARRKRMERTEKFAYVKNLDGKRGGKGWLSWWWTRWWSGKENAKRTKAKGVVGDDEVYPPYRDSLSLEEGRGGGDGAGESEQIQLMKLRNAEEARHHREVEKLMLIGDYQYRDDGKTIKTKRTSTTPSTLPSLYDYSKGFGGDKSKDGDVGRAERRREDAQRRARQLFPDSVSNSNSDSSNNRLSAPSLYSQLTGLPRNAPEPRQPVKMGGGVLKKLQPPPREEGRRPELNSRYSSSTLVSGSDLSSSSFSPPSRDFLHPNGSGRSSPMTVAEEYALSVRPKLKLVDVESPSGSRAPSPSPQLGTGLGGSGSYWMTPNHTGGSTTKLSSKNPFRI
ncbi:hypothetical protein K435DRAFT_744555 [Dendrothele bispora CBS 962.96]|uniref:EGF-like domain-containing protein n=1 Tax=Dendrothele bispora (strain CBS 962.96) TaxID=1314807 RepID=A0A4S8MRE4_DENBC|nr:hypothetical protein K435DRAFT_744555 [Dendrothele bispora CBS 962.96]